MNNQDFIKPAVVEAQKRYLQDGPLEVGRKAAHPDEPIVCQIEEILADGMVIIGWPPLGIRRTVPASELFDPNTARDLAVNAKASTLMCQRLN